MNMGIQPLFREQLDSITNYFVRFDILFFINFKTVFYQQQFQFSRFFLRVSKQPVPNWWKSNIRKPTVPATAPTRNH